MRFVRVSDSIVSTYLAAARAGGDVTGAGRNAFVAVLASAMDALAHPEIFTRGERTFPWVRFGGDSSWNVPAGPVALVGVMPMPKEWRSGVHAGPAADGTDSPDALRRDYYFALRRVIDRFAVAKTAAAAAQTNASGDFVLPDGVSVLAVEGPADAAMMRDAARFKETDAQLIAEATTLLNAARAFITRLQTAASSGSLPAAGEAERALDRAFLTGESRKEQEGAQTAERRGMAIGAGMPVFSWGVGGLFKKSKDATL